MDIWRRINDGDAHEAAALLRASCGSSRWVDRMLARRPFAGVEALLAAAREEWFTLTADDWREAFRHHPRIGDREALAARFPETHHLSAGEQAGIDRAGADVLTALANGNRAYEDRFGFIFIICATGRTAVEMLAALSMRLDNDVETELRIAAEEQAKITALRLTRPPPPSTAAAADRSPS